MNCELEVGCCELWVCWFESESEGEERWSGFTRARGLGVGLQRVGFGRELSASLGELGL